MAGFDSTARRMVELAPLEQRVLLSAGLDVVVAPPSVDAQAIIVSNSRPAAQSASIDRAARLNASPSIGKMVVAHISMKNVETSGGNLGPVQLTIANKSDRTIRILKYHTPFAGFDTNMFDVTFGSGAEGYTAAPYRGYMTEARRPSHIASGYVTIRPGHTASVTLSLVRGYDLSKSGSYRARLALPIAYTTRLASQVKEYSDLQWVRASGVVEFTRQRAEW